MNAVAICSRLGRERCTKLIMDLPPSVVRRLLAQAHVPVVRSAQSLSLKNRNELWARRLAETVGQEGVATGVLYAWLGNCRNAMLADFLDQLGVAHQNGLTDEDFWGQTDPEKLKTAAGALLEKYPKQEVAMYLLFLEDANRQQRLGELSLEQHL